MSKKKKKKTLIVKAQYKFFKYQMNVHMLIITMKEMVSKLKMMSKQKMV